MTDSEDDDRSNGPRDAAERRHRFSAGQGFGDPYEEFDLEPPELAVDPDEVDPVDARVLPDLLDEHAVPDEAVDAESVLEVGLNYMGINRHEQAVDAFERAARFAADDRLAQEAWVNKGVAHAELEEYDAAIGAYEEALRLEREAREPEGEGGGERRRSSSEHAASAHANLSYALWEHGETDRALEHAERAVEIDERFAAGWYNRAFFLAERGLDEEALFCIDNAITLGMREAHVLEEKARILESMGEDERAEEVADEAAAIRRDAEERLVE